MTRDKIKPKDMTREMRRAVIGIGEGLPMYTKGVLCALGYTDEWVRWWGAYTTPVPEHDDEWVQWWNGYASPSMTSSDEYKEIQERRARAWKPIAEMREQVIYLHGDEDARS